MPLIYVKLYTYQILEPCLTFTVVLACVISDIKPQNLLVNPHTHQVKLCDFGSAKVLVKGEPNISYICSRYYRAPELILEQPSIQQPLMSGLQDVFLLSSCLTGFGNAY
ncbi:hypothetical protein Bca52824_061573 [Brassica carinata]|uniref:Protein kinase domain-containing protein n=1 Tax=Brassica carinata TaxID=52824 RepID=A0A8X7R3C5_BRACI|nr:hypothetical protein Bca52824_061573 [Brassica carinata]